MRQPNHLQMSFDQFRRILAQELAVDEAEIIPEASFIEDLVVDSIRMVEMLVHLEEAGFHIPLEAAWEIETVADAYHCYVDHASPQARHGHCAQEKV